MAGSFAWVPRPALRTAPLRLPIAAPIGAEDLCHPVPHRLPFTGQGWIFELKRDGFRALARTGVASALLSRSGRAMADPFPEVMRALSSLHRNLVLDGELVVRSERAVRLRRGSAPQPTAAAADDCRRRVTPARGPRRVRCARVRRRRPAAAATIRTSGRPSRSRDAYTGVQIIEHVETQARRCSGRLSTATHEGIVAKRMDAPYRAGPRNTWLKIKNRNYSRRGAVEWHG